jgi:hypothetical protein
MIRIGSICAVLSSAVCPLLVLACSSAGSDAVAAQNSDLSTTDIDPFDPASCAGDPLSAEQATQYFTPGSFGNFNIGSYKVYARTRNCVETPPETTPKLRSCTSWQPGNQYGVEVPGGRYMSEKVPLQSGNLGVTLSSFWQDPGTVRLSFGVLTCGPVGNASLDCRTSNDQTFGSSTASSVFLNGNMSPWSVTATATSQCARAVLQATNERHVLGLESSWLEVEAVFLGTLNPIAH